MKSSIPQIGPIVYCTFAEQNGNPNPITHTNMCGDVAHCNYCGATDHAQPKGA